MVIFKSILAGIATTAALFGIGFLSLKIPDAFLVIFAIVLLVLFFTSEWYQVIRKMEERKNNK